MVTPIVQYMLLSEDVQPDPDQPACMDIKCLMSTIVSIQDPPYPHFRDRICIYLVLSDCHGTGTVQIRVAFMDGEQEEPLFGLPERTLDFTGRSPLDLLGVVFRLDECNFPAPGRYAVQFWYNRVKVEERPLQLR